MSRHQLGCLYDVAMVRAPGRSAVTAALCLAACSASADVRMTPAIPGVVLEVVPDLSGEPDDVAFAAVPDLLVTEDGRAIYAAPDEFAIQGALVPDVWVQEISSVGVELVRASISTGEPPQNIGALTALAGPELGDVDRFFADTFRFVAIEVGPVASFDDPDTPIVEWPGAASLALADASECTRLPELEVGEAFVTAAEDSVFVDRGIVYGVVAAPDWPGAPC